MAQEKISQKPNPASKNTKQSAKPGVNVPVGSFEEFKKLNPSRIRGIKVLPR